MQLTMENDQFIMEYTWSQVPHYIIGSYLRHLQVKPLEILAPGIQEVECHPLQQVC